MGIKWHNFWEEDPRPNTEVLAEVQGFSRARFVVLKWRDGVWLQHIPIMNELMPSDGWIRTKGIAVVRWAYFD